MIMSKCHMDNLYKSKNFLVKYIHNERLKQIYRYVLEFLPEKLENFKLLDAGCGEGHLLELLSKEIDSMFLYGVDIREEIMDCIKKRGIENTYLQDLCDLNFQDNYFDIIICAETIEHIKNFSKALEELKRITKRGGTMILTFPNELNWTISRFLLLRRPIKVPDHVNSFTFKSIKAYMKLPVVRKRTVPFNMPSFLSLTNICVFRKN